MNILQSLLKSDSIYLRIVGINLIFVILFALLLLYNTFYLKSTIKQNIDQTNKDSLLNIAGSIDHELSKIKKSVYSLSMNNDIYSLGKKSASPAYYTQLEKFNQKLLELNRLMPFDSSVYVYFKNAGFVTGADGSRGLDLFYKKLRAESKSFQCNCLHELDSDESWFIQDGLIFYAYRIKNTGYIFVKIEKDSLEGVMEKSASVLNNTMVVTTADGKYVAGSQVFNAGDLTKLRMRDNSIDLNGKPYTNIGLSLNEFNYSILYGENAVQEKMKTANHFIAVLFGLFLGINIIFLVMNIFVYKPINRTIKKLNLSNSSMEKIITEQTVIMEQNALLRLASSGSNRAVSPEMVDSLSSKYKSYYVLSSLIETADGHKALSAIEEYERTLGECCYYQKLLHRSDTDIYLIYNTGDADIREIASALYERLVSEPLFLLCGISNLHEDITNIDAAVRESLLAIDKTTLDSSLAYHIAYYPDIAHRKEIPFALSLEKEQELVAYVLKGNAAGVGSFFNTTVKAMMLKLTYKETRNMIRYIHDLLNIIVASKQMKTGPLTDANEPEFSAAYGIPYMYETLLGKYLQLTQHSIQQDTTLHQKIVEYIDSNFSLDLSMTMIADHFAISTVYLSSYFKKNTGVNLSHYIQVVRIREATKLMEEDRTLQIKDVARRVGYTNVGTFIRHFKKLSGTTPTQYFNDEPGQI